MRTVNILRTFFFLVIFAVGCGESITKEEVVIGIAKQHDTRINVICEVGKNKYIEKSVHKSQAAVCGQTIVIADDYLSGKKFFGPLPGYEEEYKKYLSTKKKNE